MREPLLTQLLDGYDIKWSAEQKSDFLGRLLELRRPATPDRMFWDEPVCRAAQNGTRALHVPAVCGSPTTIEPISACVCCADSASHFGFNYASQDACNEAAHAFFATCRAAAASSAARARRWHGASVRTHDEL